MRRRVRLRASSRFHESGVHHTDRRSGDTWACLVFSTDLLYRYMELLMPGQRSPHRELFAGNLIYDALHNKTYDFVGSDGE